MRLPDDPQALAEIACGKHRRVSGKRTQDFRERMIEGEITGDGFCAGPVAKETATPLLHVDTLCSDCAGKTRAAGLPMKDLSGLKRPREIEIRGCDSSQ